MIPALILLLSTFAIAKGDKNLRSRKLCNSCEAEQLYFNRADANNVATRYGDTYGRFDDGMAPHCGGGNYQGRWYKFTGTGQRMFASTCSPNTNYDSYLTLFSGWTCDQLSCMNVESDDALEACAYGGLHSHMGGFYTDPNTEYYILVHGWGDSVGSYELTVGFEDTGNPPTDPPYRQCQDAQELYFNGRRELTGASANEVQSAPPMNVGTVYGDTSGAPVDNLIARCDEGNYQGRWYKFMGTGAVMYASTCSPNTNYDSWLTVYLGDNTCSYMTCWVQNDDNGGHPECVNGQHSRVSFYTYPGEWYWILVHGYPGEMPTGPFALEVGFE